MWLFFHNILRRMLSPLRSRWEKLNPWLVSVFDGIQKYIFGHPQRSSIRSNDHERIGPLPHASPQSPNTIVDHHGNLIEVPQSIANSASTSKRQKQVEAYINLIQQCDVLRLASDHNNGRNCREFKSSEHGSFNVCFFVEFPATSERWVLRFPICTVLFEPLSNLKRELAVMRYISKHTTIPVPRIHGDSLSRSSIYSESLPYSIIEYIPGSPLTPEKLKGASPKELSKLYVQLADILCQLRSQEFPKPGSLIEDSNGKIIISASHSIDLNDLQLQGVRGEPQSQSTAFDFTIFCYEVLVDRLSIPEDGMSVDDAQHEVFALHDFKTRLLDFLDQSLNHGPFVLSHGDFRPANILIDEEFTIAGIIDWQWAAIIPRQYFVPPNWLTGYEVFDISDKSYQNEYERFHHALLDVSSSSGKQSILSTEWLPTMGSSIDLFLPIALLNHSLFGDIYYRTLFRKFHDIPRRKKLSEFFNDENNKHFKDMAQEKANAKSLSSM